jgi:hypothetical protein
VNPLFREVLTEGGNLPNITRKHLNNCYKTVAGHIEHTVPPTVAPAVEAVPMAPVIDAVPSAPFMVAIPVAPIVDATLTALVLYAAPALIALRHFQCLDQAHSEADELTPFCSQSQGGETLHAASTKAVCSTIEMCDG